MAENDTMTENEPAAQSQQQPDDDGQRLDEIECEPLDECLIPSNREGPENLVFFHWPHRIGRVAQIPQELDDASIPPPDVSCVPVADATLDLVSNLNIVQTWCFQELALDDLASTLALAPGETHKYTVKRTQRSELERDVLTSSESIEAFENAIIDKEVMNVTRTSAHNLNWEVSANGSIRLGVFASDVKAGVSGEARKTAKNSLEQLEETTEKSSRQLKLLQKLEVGRKTETVVETGEVRTVSNPFPDRPLQLNFYELSKQYHVTNELDPETPFDYALVLDVGDLAFDRAFVLDNKDFLKKRLIDRELWSELQEALRRGTVRPGTNKAQWFARKALSYLFEQVNVFGLNPPDPVTASLAEWNDPAFSFRGQYVRSGYTDARTHGFGEGFSALNIYYKIYLDETGGGAETIDDERAIQLALTLADYVGPIWKSLGGGDKSDLLDNHDFTEVIRRLPGFLALVEEGVRPAVSGSRPAEAPAAGDGAGAPGDGSTTGEEAVSVLADRGESEVRADSVIARVVEHIVCNKAYYIKAYLDYIFEVTSGFALRDTLEDIERRARAGGFAVADVFDLVDVNAAYQDGYHYVVPKRRDVDRGAFEGVMFDVLEETTDGVSTEVKREIETFDGTVEPTVLEDVSVPMDGYYLEAVQGPDCIDEELPARGGSVSASIDIDITEGTDRDDG